MSEGARQAAASGLGGFDLTDCRPGEQPVFEEAATAERQLTVVGGDAHNDGVAEHTTERPGVPRNSPSGNRNAVGVEPVVVHHVPYRYTGKNLKPAG